MIWLDFVMQELVWSMVALERPLLIINNLNRFSFDENKRGAISQPNSNHLEKRSRAERNHKKRLPILLTNFALRIPQHSNSFFNWIQIHRNWWKICLLPWISLLKTMRLPGSGSNNTWIFRKLKILVGSRFLILLLSKETTSRIRSLSFLYADSTVI